jgi:Trk K+ transport system NAD-binding subunit
LDVYLGDGSHTETFRKVNLQAGSYVVVLTGNNELNVEICALVRQEFQHERIISIPATKSMEDRMRSLGVEILDARRILASTMENIIIRPGTYYSLIQTYEHYSVEDITVLNQSIEGKRVMELPIHKDGMLMLLTRGHDKYVPHGDTYLREGDILTVFGTGTAIKQIREIISRNSPPGFPG